MSRENIDFNFRGIWELDFKFEAFEGFQLKASEPSDGKVKLIINGELSEDTDPKESQLNTVKYISQNSKVIKSAILSGLPNYYEEVKGQWGIVSNNPDFPDIKNSDAFSKYVVVRRVYILNAEKSNFSYYGLEGGCHWDEEHGIGFLMHKDKIVSIGQAEVVNNSWIPFKDNGTYEIEIAKREELKNKKPILYKPHPIYGTLKPKQISENKMYEYRLIERGYNDEFIKLVQKGLIKPDGSKYLPITYLARAVQFNNFELCKFMLGQNSIDKSGVIQLATNKQMVELCTANGIDINEKDIHNKTLYHVTKRRLDTQKNQLKYAVNKDPTEFLELETFFNYIISIGATE